MRVHIHVNPGSRSTSIQWRENLLGDKTLIIKIREKPINGDANKGAIEAIADFFNVSKSSIKILQGHTSREKVVEIEMD